MTAREFYQAWSESEESVSNDSNKPSVESEQSSSDKSDRDEMGGFEAQARETKLKK